MTSHTEPRRNTVFTPAALPLWAVAASGCGVVAAIPALPSVARGLLLAVFVFVAPGAAILSWARVLPANTIAALVPATGLAVTLIVTGIASLAGLWQPRATLLAIAVASAATAIWARRSKRADAVS